MDYLNLEELVDYAEVSGFDIESGSYLQNVNLLNQNVMEEKSSLDVLNIIKSVFGKKETTV